LSVDDLKAAIAAQLDDVVRMAADEDRSTAFCIGNTAKPSSLGWFLTPIRHAPSVVAGSVIVYADELARAAAEAVDGTVDYVLVDAEKKIRAAAATDYVPNPERVIRETVRRSKVLTYKGNDLVVDAVDSLLSQMVVEPVRGLGGKRVGIVGAGNVGSKVALRLIERGAQVRLYRRSRADLEVIVDAVNRIRPVGTTARATAAKSVEDAVAGADILVGATDGAAAIDADMVGLLAPQAILIEAGKGSICPDAIVKAIELGFPVLRVDVRAAFAGHIETVLRTERALGAGLSRRQVGEFSLVGAGLVGLRGDIVVDNVTRPVSVFGIADGAGDFLRDLGEAEMGRLARFKDMISSMRRGGRT